MFHLIPAPLHRALLPLAYSIRRRWRQWRKFPIAGTSVVITDLNDDVLLLRHSYGPKGWALPGGGLGKSEDPQAGARREVREELGIEVGVMTALGIITEELSGTAHTAHLFTARAVDQPRPDRREILEARYFPPHSLPEPMGDATRRRLALWRQKSNA